VSAALGYSYNAVNWTAFGQLIPPQRASQQRRARGVPPTVQRGPLIDTDLTTGVVYSHTYKHFTNVTAGALACQAECDTDPECAAYTYVANNTCCGVERCCRRATIGCPMPRVGCYSGAKVAGPCVGPAPSPPPPPPPPPIALPELFPNLNGSLYAGQIYPSTLIDMPDEGRVLIHASASTHQHGLVSTAPETWSSLLTFELRRDGFTYLSVAKVGAAGTAVTWAVRWLSGELALNADCAMPGNNSVTVSVVDSRGIELPGYGRSEAVRFAGNSTAHAVTWQSGAGMASLSGRDVAFVLHLSGACKVYSCRGNFTGPL
jgi:hypothetical protein